MPAHTILPHQLSASILFFYALLALCISAKRSSRLPRKRPPRSVGLPPKLTHRDVDLRYCTVDELEYMTVLLLTQADDEFLTEAETQRFLAVSQELENRRKHGASVISISGK
jgi:hypothetical protein